MLASSHCLRTASCSGVWNQCSIPSAAVREQRKRRAKRSTVSRGTRWSFWAQRMRVGVSQRETRVGADVLEIGPGQGLTELSGNLSLGLQA